MPSPAFTVYVDRKHDKQIGEYIARPEVRDRREQCVFASHLRPYYSEEKLKKEA